MNQQNVLLFEVTAHDSSNQQKNSFPEGSFFTVSCAFAPYLYPWEVLAVGIQQFIRNWSSSKDVPLSLLNPQLGGGEVPEILCLGYCKGKNPVGCMCPLCESMCAVSLHPSPSIDAHITDKIQWKTHLQLAKLHCFQKPWWDWICGCHQLRWGSCWVRMQVVLLVWLKLRNTSSRQRYPLGYAKKLLLPVLRTISILWLHHRCLD